MDRRKGVGFFQWINITVLFATGLTVGLATSLPAEARVFDMKNEVVATYFGGTYGYSALSDKAFGQAAGSGVTTDQVVRTNLSGEFGVVLTGSRFSMRFGGEYLFGRNINGAKGLNASGVEYFEVDSKVSAFIPWAILELPLVRTGRSRVSFGGGVGYAMAWLDQEYRMTTAGTAALGVSNYSEKGSGYALAWRLFLSAETNLVDTATIGLEAGYRNVNVGTLDSSIDSNAIVGTESKGAPLKNSDGSNRAIDLGGPYGGVFLRFYL